jgi:hypothetical protein
MPHITPCQAIQSLQSLRCRLDDPKNCHLIPGIAGCISLCYHAQIGCDAHPPSYPVGTVGSLPEVKQRVPLSTHLQPELKVKTTNVPSQV